MKQEKWINEVMASLNNLQTPNPSPKLFLEIEKKLIKNEVRTIPMHWVVATAASFVLLAVVNFWILKTKNKRLIKANSIELLTEKMGLTNAEQLYY
jgi:hypothetical protein